MTNNIFDQNDEAADQQEQSSDQQSTPDVTSVLAEIKNEKGEQKYATVEKAIEGLANAQQYIPTLEQEKKALADELAALKAKQENQDNVEDVVDRLLEARKATDNADQQVQSLSEDDIAAIVRKEQERLALANTTAQNTQKVSDALEGIYGDKAQEELANKATELGTTVEKLGQLAAESPTMVLSLFNSGNTSPKTTPEGSTVNTALFKETTHTELAPPERSLLSGATSAEQLAYMQKIKEDVYRRLGVQA